MQEVDPVSGNEVPLGAKPEEVRDDIDAKVSENEFIVPADVVRYFGVKHFEDLISKAKKGFEDLEANGRIGGEAPDDDDDEEMDPELLAILQEEEMGAEEPLKMATGGLVPNMTREEVTQQQYTPPESIFGPGGTSTGSGSGVQSVMYINAEGHRRAILFIDGRPIQSIPEGYAPDTGETRDTFEEAEEVTREETDGTGADPDGSGDHGGAEGVGAPGPDLSSQEAFDASHSNFNGSGRGFGMVGDVVGGLVGGAFLGSPAVGVGAARGIGALSDRSQAATLGREAAWGSHAGLDTSNLDSQISGLPENLAEIAMSTRDREQRELEDARADISAGLASSGIMGRVQDRVDQAYAAQGTPSTDTSTDTEAPSTEAPSTEADDDSDDNSGPEADEYGGFNDYNKGGLVKRPTTKKKEPKKPATKKKGLGARN